VSATARLKQVDVTASGGLMSEPSVAGALDPDAVSPHLSRALFGGVALTSCRPHSALWEPGLGLSLRYGIRIAGRDQEMLAVARVFPAGGARAYYHHRLAPLADQMPAHPEVPAGCRPAGVVEALSMAVSLWPLDGELPGLMGATDPTRIASSLAGWGFRDLTHVGVTRDHYGRRNRCVLRYSISRPRGTATLYGKVSGDGRGLRAATAIERLGRDLRARTEGNLLLIPRVIGYAADLELLVLDEVPGRPAIGSLVKRAARVPGDHPELSRALAQAAAVASAIHETELVVGRRREARSEADTLLALCADLESLSAEATDRVSACLHSALRHLSRVPPSRVGLGHGDFSHSQLLTNSRGCGLIDFDTMCQAEPALDLGHFTAYLRLLVTKAAPSAGAASLISDRLCTAFLDAYRAQSSLYEGALLERTAGYEVLSLARLTLHSIQKMKTDRLANVLNVLEERAKCLKP
jgi:hypothetical protein